MTLALPCNKALERFQRARATLIGDLVLDIQPADAVVLVDGRAVEPAADSSVPLVAGDAPLGAAEARRERNPRDVGRAVTLGG